MIIFMSFTLKLISCGMRNAVKTVSWGENLEVPPESDDDDDDGGGGGGGGEDGNTEWGGGGPGGSSLDDIADGFVDDDILKSDDGDDDDGDDDDDDDENERRHEKQGGGSRPTNERLALLTSLAEASPRPEVAPKMEGDTAARLADARQKVSAHFPTALSRGHSQKVFRQTFRR